MFNTVYLGIVKVIIKTIPFPSVRRWPVAIIQEFSQKIHTHGQIQEFSQEIHTLTLCRFQLFLTHVCDLPDVWTLWSELSEPPSLFPQFPLSPACTSQWLLNTFCTRDVPITVVWMYLRQKNPVQCPEGDPLWFVYSSRSDILHPSSLSLFWFPSVFLFFLFLGVSIGFLTKYILSWFESTGETCEFFFVYEPVEPRTVENQVNCHDRTVRGVVSMVPRLCETLWLGDTNSTNWVWLGQTMPVVVITDEPVVSVHDWARWGRGPVRTVLCQQIYTENPNSIVSQKQWECNVFGTTATGGPESLLEPDSRKHPNLPMVADHWSETSKTKSAVNTSKQTAWTQEVRNRIRQKTGEIQAQGLLSSLIGW